MMSKHHITHDMWTKGLKGGLHAQNIRFGAHLSPRNVRITVDERIMKSQEEKYKSCNNLPILDGFRDDSRDRFTGKWSIRNFSRF